MDQSSPDVTLCIRVELTSEIVCEIDSDPESLIDELDLAVAHRILDIGLVAECPARAGFSDDQLTALKPGRQGMLDGCPRCGKPVPASQPEHLFKSAMTLTVIDQ